MLVIRVAVVDFDCEQFIAELLVFLNSDAKIIYQLHTSFCWCILLASALTESINKIRDPNKRLPFPIVIGRQL